MQSDDERGPKYPADHAFVVQFSPGTAAEALRGGRVEHMVSGRNGRFENGEQLLNFVAEVLSEMLAGTGHWRRDEPHD